MKGEAWTLIVQWDPCGQAPQPMRSTAEGQPGLIRLQQGSRRKQAKRRWKNLYTQIEMKEKFASGAGITPAKILWSSFRKTLKHVLKPITIQGSP